MTHLNLPNPLVSIVLPVFNGSSFIQAAIRSILQQTYTDWELIIIDDGSNDDTHRLVTAIQNDRIRLITHAANQGIVPSLNRGLAEARGSYIARMDADDICVPERLALQVAFLETNRDCILVGSSAFTIDDSGNRLAGIMTPPIENERIKASLFFTCPFIHPTIMLRRSMIEQNGITYPTQLTYAQDYGLYANIFNLGNFANLPEPLLHYRIHKGDARITHDRNSEAIIKGRMYAWRTILGQLQLTASDDVLRVHDKVCYYPARLNHDDKPQLIEYIQLLNHFKVRNKSIQLYNVGYVKGHISQCVYKTLINNQIDGLSAFKTYVQHVSLLTAWAGIKFPLNKLRRMVFSKQFSQ